MRQLFAKASVFLAQVACFTFTWLGPAHTQDYPPPLLSADVDPSLAGFVVTDSEAGFFDLAARRRLFRSSDNPILQDLAIELSIGVSCRDKLELPIVDYPIRLPPFYAEPDAWAQAVLPIFAFEQALTDLTAAYVVTDDRYFSECLIRLLTNWAQSNALEQYFFSPQVLQAWQQTEATIFMAALAYSLVRPEMETLHDDRALIESWLSRLSHRHISYNGGPASCCNNHLYRRALHAAMVGILMDNNYLFQFGVGAFRSALQGANRDGSLPLEVARGRLAAHYQNYALIYLVMLGHLIEQQGYSAFSWEIDGITIHDIVRYNIELLQNPRQIVEYAPGVSQDLSWQEDQQYFAWIELYHRYEFSDDLENLATVHRPLVNRSSGGHMTVFFFHPNGVDDNE